MLQFWSKFNNDPASDFLLFPTAAASAGSSNTPPPVAAAIGVGFRERANSQTSQTTRWVYKVESTHAYFTKRENYNIQGISLAIPQNRPKLNSTALVCPLSSSSSSSPTSLSSRPQRLSLQNISLRTIKSLAKQHRLATEDTDDTADLSGTSLLLSERANYQPHGIVPQAVDRSPSNSISNNNNNNNGITSPIQASRSYSTHSKNPLNIPPLLSPLTKNSAQNSSKASISSQPQNQQSQQNNAQFFNQNKRMTFSKKFNEQFPDRASTSIRSRVIESAKSNNPSSSNKFRQKSNKQLFQRHPQGQSCVDEQENESQNSSLSFSLLPPNVQSRNIAVFDMQTSEFLVRSQASEPTEIASLSKIMTCFLVCELLSTKHYAKPSPHHNNAIKTYKVALDKTTKITVSRSAASIGGTSASLLEGDSLSLWNLLHGLMLPSGNDAAITLAQTIGQILLIATQAIPTSQPMQLSQYQFLSSQQQSQSQPQQQQQQQIQPSPFSKGNSTTSIGNNNINNNNNNSNCNSSTHIMNPSSSTLSTLQINQMQPPKLPSKKQGYQEFINAMNAMAVKLELESTRFSNPHGLSSPSTNTSSASDLCILISRALKNTLFREIVGTKSIFVEIVRREGNTGLTKPVTLTYTNTNKLLFRDASCIGIKTGITPKAGPCLASAFQLSNDKTIILVVLKAPTLAARFTESSQILVRVKEHFLKHLQPNTSEQQNINSHKNNQTNKDVLLEIQGQYLLSSSHPLHLNIPTSGISKPSTNSISPLFLTTSNG